MTHKLKSFKHFSISIFRMMAYTLNNFKTVLTCSPAWHLAARCSWKGSAVICWCCHTELSGAGGPIWVCSHTIATYRNTLTMKYSDNGLQICKIICKKTQKQSVIKTTSSIQTLVVRVSSFSFWGYFKKDKHPKNNADSPLAQPLMLKFREQTELDLRERSGWWESSWCLL